ncbi:MAG TPA: hypothetical protein VLG37_04945 [Candidatus Saccharimonadales bacterium]|nr:hypothetical protein [Candidatus Saccharimonadales bacterium]
MRIRTTRRELIPAAVSGVILAGMGYVALHPKAPAPPPTPTEIFTDSPSPSSPEPTSTLTSEVGSNGPSGNKVERTLGPTPDGSPSSTRIATPEATPPGSTESGIDPGTVGSIKVTRSAPPPTSK